MYGQVIVVEKKKKKVIRITKKRELSSLASWLSVLQRQLIDRPNEG
jgi:hypothetical protein